MFLHIFLCIVDPIRNISISVFYELILTNHNQISTRKPLICVWNILRYSLRIWNGKQKTYDIEKIAHYAELAWSMSDGKVIKNDR
jgi:hypothetical protein